MALSYFDITVPQFIKVLGNMLTWFDKARVHAETKRYDTKNLMNARLAPDQLHFIRQVQIATDVAKGIGARLTGQEPPKYEDNEQTLEELTARVKKTIDFLKTLKPESFAEAEQRSIAINFMPGKSLPAREMTLQMAVPNFYFHSTTTYAILRHNGIDLGKKDFLGELNYREL